MNMREKIARALWDSREARMPKFTRRDPDDMDRTTGAWQIVMDDADAVLEAMREPTEGMMAAAKGALNLHDLRPDYASNSHEAATDCWQVMIDAAKEGA